VIHDTAGRADDDVDAGVQPLQLLHSLAAVHGQHAQRTELLAVSAS
jgi:hypothetical protein